MARVCDIRWKQKPKIGAVLFNFQYLGSFIPIPNCFLSIEFGLCKTCVFNFDKNLSTFCCCFFFFFFDMGGYELYQKKLYLPDA